MESYGELLQKTREAKGIDRDTASYETTISLNYLVGLENEDDAMFPGEPYMLGFMRTYSEYLGLKPDYVCSLYHAKKLQEAPIPEGLLVHEKSRFYWPLIIVLVLGVVTGLSFGGIYLYKKNSEKKIAKQVIEKEKVTTKSYEITEKPLQSRLYTGDQLILNTDSGKIILTINDTLGHLGILTPVGTLYTELSEDAELDVDGDNGTDLIVYVSDISGSDPTRGAMVRVLKGLGSKSENAIETSDTLGGKHAPVEVFRDNRAYPFTLNGSFRAAALFRYRIDRKDPIERYFTNGEVVTMTANNGVRLWISNCNGVKLSVIADSRNYNLPIGKAGQVLVEDIKWIRDTTDGKYKLVVIEQD